MALVGNGCAVDQSVLHRRPQRSEGARRACGSDRPRQSAHVERQGRMGGWGKQEWAVRCPRNAGKNEAERPIVGQSWPIRL